MTTAVNKSRKHFSSAVFSAVQYALFISLEAIFKVLLFLRVVSKLSIFILGKLTKIVFQMSPQVASHYNLTWRCKLLQSSLSTCRLMSYISFKKCKFNNAFIHDCKECCCAFWCTIWVAKKLFRLLENISASIIIDVHDIWNDSEGDKEWRLWLSCLPHTNSFWLQCHRPSQWCSITDWLHGYLTRWYWLTVCPTCFP